MTHGSPRILTHLPTCPWHIFGAPQGLELATCLMALELTRFTEPIEQEDEEEAGLSQHALATLAQLKHQSLRSVTVYGEKFSLNQSWILSAMGLCSPPTGA